jgi:hypothetical protein
VAIDYQLLLAPPRLYSRADVLGPPCPVPAAAGVYAWWFTSVPGLPTAQARQRNGLALLYVGISAPGRESSTGRLSRQTLRQRIKSHYGGNAEASTLRRTLGCLLGFELRRVGNGNRMTFSVRETELSEWMAANAYVCWLACERPEEVEAALIRQEYLPLNRAQNRAHEFHAQLGQLLRAARQRARELPVLPR